MSQTLHYIFDKRFRLKDTYYKGCGKNLAPSKFVLNSFHMGPTRFTWSLQTRFKGWFGFKYISPSCKELHVFLHSTMISAKHGCKFHCYIPYTTFLRYDSTSKTPTIKSATKICPLPSLFMTYSVWVPQYSLHAFEPNLGVNLVFNVYPQVVHNSMRLHLPP